VTTAEVVARCPECGSGELAGHERPPSWCPTCEWNLGAWPTPKIKSRRRRRAVLRNRAAAFAINAALLDELRGHRPDRPTATRARVVLAAASVALALVDVALVVLGVLALVYGNLPLRVVGLLAVLIGIECRPRIPRLDLTYGQITRRDAPEFYRLLDEAADALGAPHVDAVLLDDDFNAFCGRSGVRRRVVLGLGLPLWGALSPAGRQALLGHELGHLVNGDPGRGFLTQVGVTTFARLADIFDPRKMVGSGQNWVIDLIGNLVAYPLFGPFHLVCRWASDRVVRVAARDHQRAEVYADALAVRLGGTDGAEELARMLVYERAVWFAVRRVAAEGSADPAAWSAAALAAISAQPPGEDRLREQESLRREASLYRTHPPAGLRLRLVRSWPDAVPDRPPPTARFAAADAEVGRRFETVRRALINQNFA
jgi:Zn-dependent protease with chaperone function